MGVDGTSSANMAGLVLVYRRLACNVQRLEYMRDFFPPVSLVLMLSTLLFLGGCEATAEDQRSEPLSNDSERIAIDVGVVVADMQDALGYYQGILGLPIIAEVRTSLIGKGTMVQLKHGSSLIKLLQMDSPPSGKSQKGIASAFGNRYITLMVSDIQPFVDKVHQHKVPVYLELTELGNGAKIMMVEDPDGNIVEFVQEAN